MRLSAAASVLFALAFGATAPLLALHPTHPRDLARHSEVHLSSHRPAAHAAGHHSRPSHTTSYRASVANRNRPTGRSHSHTHGPTPAALVPASRPLRLGRRHGRQIAQPTHFSGSRSAYGSANTAAQASVISLVRSTPAQRPQLPDLAEAVTEPLASPKIYDHGHLLVPAALVGSHEILLHQNAMADQDGLGRIQNDADLDAMRARGMLVALPAGPALNVDPRLPYNRRFARPWTAQFMADLSRAYFRRFGAPLQLTSAVRTVEFQQHLMHHNGNAAPADGDTASPHLTGQAVDLGKRGMSLAQIAWMRGYLLPLIQSGTIDVEEEFRQSCFHISVYRRYAPPTLDHYSVASRGTTSSLATVLP